MLKLHLTELVDQALLDMLREGQLPAGTKTQIQIERTRSKEHGDFATNVALTLAKPAKRNPREIAENIVSRLLESRHVEKVEVAGPGFINFYLSKGSKLAVVKQVLKLGERFGFDPHGSGERVSVEFVSANPTGPLHVGHGRGAAFGASLASILQTAGYEVQREYYVNDKGRQMDILATSVWLRYLELGGVQARFPDNGYRGQYIYDIARKVRNVHGDLLRVPERKVGVELPPDESEGGDKEAHIDALVNQAKTLLGDSYPVCYEAALEAMVADISDDLKEFRVLYDKWFSERSLFESEAVDRAIAQLKQAGHMYEREGAWWYRATEFGDEKDRVVIRDNGVTTYFASDIAYILSKLERFDRAIYVLGADHHGYVARLKAAAKGLGFDPERLEILLVQFAHLFRDGEKIPMSTRAGQFVTLRELREEVGADAARFFYVMRSHEQHLDFDLNLAKSRTKDNPVYYVQYAHARICSVFAELTEKSLTHNTAIGDASLKLLDKPQEVSLIDTLGRYPDVLETAARTRGPHMVAHYLRDLANHFHSWYDNRECRMLVDDVDLRNARLNLAAATGQVLKNGLALLGVEAPDSM